MKKRTPTPLPPEEIDLGRSVRLCRESRMIPKARFAEVVRLKTTTLASYEDGRAPLPWGVFVRMWDRFGISPRYLATQAGPAKIPYALFRFTLPKIDPKLRFSQVWALYLSKVFEDYDGTMRAMGTKAISDFLAKAQGGEVSVEAIAAVSQTIHEHTAATGPAKVKIARSEPAPVTPPASPAPELPPVPACQ